MAREKPPAFQLYVRDWLAGTRDLTLKGRGAYIDLLAFAWDADGLPDDPKELRRRVGATHGEWRQIWPVLETKFPVSPDGRRRNQKQEKVRAEMRAYQESCSRGGQRSAAVRQQRHGTAQPSKPLRTRRRSEPRSDLEVTAEATTEVNTEVTSNLAPAEDQNQERSPLKDPEAHSAAAEPVPRLTAKAFGELWNRWHPPLPKCLEVNGARQRHIQARLKSHPDEAYWSAVIGKIAVTPFCLGQNDRNWKASFDWLLRPDSAARVLEGKYDDSPRNASSKSRQRAAAFDQWEDIHKAQAVRK